MKLSLYIDQIKIMMSGGHVRTDFPIDDRVIWFTLGQERDKAIWLKTLNDYKTGDRNSAELAQGLLTTYYGFEAVCDTDRDQFYVPLIQNGFKIDWVKGLPNDFGLFMLAPQKSIVDAYKKATPSFLTLYGGTPVEGAEGHGVYWPEVHGDENRLYLANHTKNAPKIFMLMIVPAISENTNLDTDINMPSDIAADVVEATRQKLTLRMPPDLANNSNSVPA